jgi:hypothetical protein
MYIQRIDTLTSKDKEKVLNSKKTTYLIQGGGDFGLYSNSNLTITMQIVESIEALHCFNLFLQKIDKELLPTAPLYKVLTYALEGVELTYKDKNDLLDLFVKCWQWGENFYTIHDNLKLVPRYEVIYFACGLLGCSEYENDNIISKYEAKLSDLLYELGNENMLKCEFLNKIDEIINQPKTDKNKPTNETE